MSILKKFYRSPAFAIALFVLAAGLLLTGTVGGARAALTIESQRYSTQVELGDIGITLNENGTSVGSRDYASLANGTWDTTSGALLTNMIPEGESLKIGTVYPEVLSVTNSGGIDEYVRVTIYRYWVAENADGTLGEKLQDLDPGYIDLQLDNVGGSWILDSSSSTKERTVLYYSSLLHMGETTAPFSSTIRIDDGILAKVKKISTTTTEDGVTRTVWTYEYEYDGARFQLDVMADAVQDHNAEAAILSAWGRHVTISGETLSLAD